MSKVNYPVKYSVLNSIEVTEKNDLYYRYGLVGYFVSKVYVVGESITYAEDGTSKKEYQIVFPYLNRTDLLEEKRNVPKYDYSGKCVNSRSVSEVFDSYEMAKQASEYMYLQYGNCENFDGYQDFETELLQATDDMKTALELSNASSRVLVKK